MSADYRAILTAYVALFAAVVLVLLVRGPVREAAWGDDCHTLRTGGAIQSTETNQTIIEACRDLEPTTGSN